MKKALVIGGAGFVGNYLIEHLQCACKWKVFATKLPTETFEVSDVISLELDILNFDNVISVLREVRPDYIFHLAAQSSVAVSWKQPALTVDINIKGCINILEAVRQLDFSPRILLVGSSEEYGMVKEKDIPVLEEQNVEPANIYAVTKVCQNMLGAIYAKAYQMNIIMVRAFNHVGPRQSSIFVVSDFCKQVAEIEKMHSEPIIRVGNLSARRDFTDVRDVVSAYALLAQKGQSGETYNVGSGEAISIKEVLDIIVKYSNKTIRIQEDVNKFRPLDVPIVQADIQKLLNATGWKRVFSIEDTIQDMLNYWRSIDLVKGDKK